VELDWLGWTSVLHGQHLPLRLPRSEMRIAH
jgi:hypothetical protein